MKTLFVVLLSFLLSASADSDTDADTESSETVPGPEMLLKPSGESHKRGVSASIVFSCEVETDQSYDLRWFSPKDVEITEKSGRIYLEDDNGGSKKLYVTDIVLEDRGTYTCRAVVGETTLSKSTNLSVFKDISFDSAPTPQHHAIYTDAVIVCKVSGKPLPVVSWKYKGKRLSPENKENAGKSSKYVVAEDGLEVRNITMKDSGDYTCQAEVESDGRFDEKKIRVEVHVPPKITEGPGKTEGIEGDEVSILCKGQGHPAPYYNFTKDNKAVQSNDRIQVDTKLGSVTFKKLAKVDEGNYTCHVSNDVGSKSADGYLKVLMKPFIHQFENKSNIEGQPISMECKSHGDPLPEFVFTKIGRNEPFKLGDNDDDRISVFKNELDVMRLSIKKLIPEDAGDYVCIATNNIGNHEAIAHLNVSYKPRFPSNHTKLVHIWAGKSRNITCEADGGPYPQFVWLRGEDVVKENSTYTIFSSEKKSILQITVQEVDQSWMYGELKCKAKNYLGENDISIDLKRATVPDSPKMVKVNETLPTGFILSVIPPEDDGGEPLSGYKVEYHVKNSVGISVTLANESAPTEHPPYQIIVADVEDKGDNILNIVNLKPSTDYVLRVRAKNEVGLGRHYQVEAKTEAIRKPYPIKISSPPEGDAFSYKIEWEKPNAGGLPIKRYEFRYREKNSVKGQEGLLEWNHVPRDVDSNQPLNSFTLNDLLPNSTYQLLVKAENDIGWSDLSPVFEFQTREATEGESSERVHSAASIGTIVGLVLFVLFLLSVVVDILCYFLVGCGVTHTLVSRSKGNSMAAEKKKVMEEGEKEHLKAQDDDDDIKKPSIIYETTEDEVEKEDDIKKERVA